MRTPAHLLASTLLLVAAAVQAEPTAPTGHAPAAPSAAATGTSATAAPQAASPLQTRVFDIRYRDASEVELLIQPALSPEHVISVDEAHHLVTVMDRPDIVARVEDFVRQLDVPPQAALVRIEIDKAERDASPAGADTTRPWRYRPLAEAVFEVLERSKVTQSFGPDGAYEVRLRLDTVDVSRHLMHFDDFAVSRMTHAPGAAAPTARELFRTPLDVVDRVDKTVMATRDPAADEAFVVRVRGVIRGPEPAAHGGD